MRFRDRRHAGALLATRLEPYRSDPSAIVLALPRGGVPVGYEVAEALDIPLDVFLVRKLGTPFNEELAMGAIASGNVKILNEEVVGSLHISNDQIEDVAIREREELERREHAYRDGRPPLNLEGKTVILVDDGLATGSSMLAAVQGVRQLHADRIVVAVPVAPPTTCHQFASLVDEVVCYETPAVFYEVGMWYEDFNQTTDADVRELLHSSRSFGTTNVQQGRDTWSRSPSLRPESERW